ncbi:MAG TPA: EscU/YscU/HrcU family type III secretion system export apparatus switch protein [Dyella sp.]|uniref:EscU/YscU/HrcU family type III secretion system export apparatus switch protein n=1 Tax=Dyella sp. TaxID=1869338 RepID=UPI002F93DC36
MKTEKPTPRRLLEETRKGKGFHSTDMSAAFTLVGGMLVLLSFTSLMAVAGLYRYVIDRGFDVLPSQMFYLALTAYAKAVAPTALASLVFALLIGLFKSGGVLATEALKIDLDRLNPVNGFKNLFSLKVVLDLLKALLYLTATAMAVIIVWNNEAAAIFRLSSANPTDLVRAWAAIGARAVLTLLAALAPVYVLAAFLDYRMHIRNLRMEKHEVKQERKDNEGDPEIKRRRRDTARELSAQTQADVAGSTLVLANPTHIAIGIYLHSDDIPLPFISVREHGAKALAVIKLAEKFNVPVVRDVRLARAIFAQSKCYTFVHSDEIEAVMRVVQWLRDVERAGQEDAAQDEA